MTEPHRLLEHAGDDLTRRLLQAGRSANDAPSEALRAKMWSGIEASLAPLAGGAAGAASAASQGSAAAGGALPGATAAGAAPGAVAASAPGVGLAIGTKIGLVGLLVGATLVTTTVVRPPEETTAPPAVVARESSQQSPQPDATTGQPADRTSEDRVDEPAPSEPAPAEAPNAKQETSADGREDNAAPRLSTKPSSQPIGSSAPKSTVSSLVEEVAAVQKARAALAQGNATEALAVLAELDRTVPRGSLGQERVVLTIEALAASGQSGKAGKLAKAFLAANPSSPYADRVRPYAL